MLLVCKTPFHFFNRQKDFDLNEAVTLSLKSIYAFGRVYMHVDGRNQLQRDNSRKFIRSVGKVPHDKKQADLVKSITQRLKSIEFLHDFKSAEYHVNGIDLTIPFISHIEGQEILVCVKTTRNASDSFEQEIIREKHYVETALMRQAVGNHYDCFILAVEVDNPHAHAFFRIDSSLLEKGDAEIAEKLELLNQCNSQNSYPSYFGGGAKTISKPNYL